MGDMQTKTRKPLRKQTARERVAVSKIVAALASVESSDPQPVIIRSLLADVALALGGEIAPVKGWLWTGGEWVPPAQTAETRKE